MGPVQERLGIQDQTFFICKNNTKVPLGPSSVQSQSDLESKNRVFFFGKNKVMVIALGKTKEDEYRENLREISKVKRKDIHV